MTTTDLTPAEVLSTAAARLRERHGPGDPVRKRRFWHEVADWLDCCGLEYAYAVADDFSIVPDPALTFARAVLAGDQP